MWQLLPQHYNYGPAHIPRDLHTWCCQQWLQKRPKLRHSSHPGHKSFGFVFLKDNAVCTLCCENVVCWTSKHEKAFKGQADKAESIKCAVARYDKQASSLKVYSTAKNHGTEASDRIVHCIAKHGKPFMDGKFMLFLKVCQMKKWSSHEWITFPMWFVF